MVRVHSNVARHRRVSSVSLVSSNHDASKVFVAEATTAGIRVPRILELNPGGRDLPAQVSAFIEHSNVTRPAVALLVASAEAAAIADYFLLQQRRGQSQDRPRPQWLIGSVGAAAAEGAGGNGRTTTGASWRRTFEGAVVAEPHMPELEDFREYFVKSMQVSKTN